MFAEQNRDESSFATSQRNNEQCNIGKVYLGGSTPRITPTYSLHWKKLKSLDFPKIHPTIAALQ